MKTSLSILLLFAVSLPAAGADPKTREETVFLFENRKVTVDVPLTLSFTSAKDDAGSVLIKLADPNDTLSMELRFLPDPEGRFANARARKDLMNDMFNDYVESSTEKAMQFEELDPRTGAGTYCIFTDANLVGKTNRPPGEYLH